ncbi:monocarboxylate transporter 12-B-like isoform X1 [Eriocheir sinensis]|uniref:monocarboxylate transporter 12-B-like isoform X1 n=1 Tax=Eriocheir sinensis TaxID=95602 RepID=UPI0021C9B602|nr:monocarboxylate transporter 12-B-like isoform X1 [Eriocheir sinensis]
MPSGTDNRALPCHRGTCMAATPEEGEERQEEEGAVPPDGGWGWVVAAGVFVIALVVPMLSPSFGILFSRQLLEWRASSTTVAVIFSTFLVVWRLAGVVLGTLIKEFGFRRVAVTGTLLTATCLTLSAFAASPVHLLITFSLGCGLGNGLSCVGYLILAHYFNKRRGRANTLLMAGAGLGHFASPHVIRFLQEEYGLRGATIILGGITLHAVLGAAVFQPVEWHYKKQESTGAAEDREDREALSSLLHEPTKNMAEEETWGESTERKACRRVLSGLVAFRGRVAQVLWSVVNDMKVLRRPTCLIIALGSMLVVNAEANFLVLVPFAIQADGHPLQTAAWCVSIAGVCNLFTRMTVSSLSDLPWFNKRLCYMGGMAVMAASILVFTLQIEDAWQTGVMGVWGCAAGVFYGLNNLLMTDVVGLPRLTAVYSAKNLLGALGFFSVGPLVGVIRDVSGSYAVSMWVLSGLIAVSFLLWLLMPAAQAYERRQAGSSAET